MIFLGLFIFFIFLFAYLRKKSSAIQTNAEEEFWARENEANRTRRQDISGLPYITIPFENFPMGIYDNSEIKACEETLTGLSEKKILNLGGQSNTDLKLKYGPANLETLTECDDNYALLCRTVVSYAQALLSLGHKAEAKTVLEGGVACGLDHSLNYLLLADLYLEEGDTGALKTLIAQAELLDSPQRDSIVRRLCEKESAEHTSD